MNIRHILYPTDFSEGSAAAFDYAKALAKQYDSEITLLYPLDEISRSRGWYVPHTSLDEFYKEMEAQATKKLEHCCYEELRDFKKVNRVIVKGLAEEVILNYAKEKGVDLIVMGTQAKSGMDFVFRSAVEKVVKKAECPVLCVKAQPGKTA
jgi:nucleotide-binding universal stress UspA family protein